MMKLSELTKMKISLNSLSRYELSKEDLEIDRKQRDYCSKFLPKDYEIKNIEYGDDLNPISFTATHIDEPKFAPGIIIMTPHGIKLRLESKMKNNGLLDLKERMNYTFDNYTTKFEWQKRAKEIAVDYVDNYDGKKWFTITGKTGSGKTHLATSIVFGLANKGIEVEYLSWVDYIQFLKSDFNEEPYRKFVIANKRVLYIDDFLKTGIDESKPRDYDMEVARTILWERHSKGLVTIISSEYDLMTDMKRHNEALVGRLVENSKEYIVQIGNKDDRNYRLYGNKK